MCDDGKLHTSAAEMQRRAPTFSVRVECSCAFWGRDNKGCLLFLEHHPNCEKYSPEEPVRRMLLQLIDGIEAWASDEDGVHSGCWDAYVAACNMIGEFDRPSTKEPV